MPASASGLAQDAAEGKWVGQSPVTRSRTGGDDAVT